MFLDAAGAAWTTDGDNTDRKLGAEVWTLEGDHELYAREPVANRRVELLLSACEPSSPLTLATTSHMHVWINRARWPLTADVTPNAHGVFAFDTYPEVVTSFRFGSAGSDERLARHYLKVKATDPNPLRRFIVLSGRIRCRGRRIRTCFAILLSLSAARSRAALSRHEVVNRAMATHAEARRVSTPSVVSTRRTFRWSTRRRRARDPSHLP